MYLNHSTSISCVQISGVISTAGVHLRMGHPWNKSLGKCQGTLVLQSHSGNKCQGRSVRGTLVPHPGHDLKSWITTKIIISVLLFQQTRMYSKGFIFGFNTYE